MDSARSDVDVVAFGEAPTLGELVDLALCTPEVGTVNFNILRLLLHGIVSKLGIDNLIADFGDVELNQIDVRMQSAHDFSCSHSDCEQLKLIVCIIMYAVEI
jgi:hypothetical protein